MQEWYCKIEWAGFLYGKGELRVVDTYGDIDIYVDRVKIHMYPRDKYPKWHYNKIIESILAIEDISDNVKRYMTYLMLKYDMENDNDNS